MTAGRGRGADAGGETALGGSAVEAAALWGELIGRLAERLAHEIRNPLNGAMVNLQVVVSRAERPASDAAALAPFATAASAELERAAAMVERLLALLRPPPPGEELSASLRTAAAVCADAAHRDGGTLRLHVSEAVATAAVDPRLARLAVAALLERATRDGGSTEVHLEGDPLGPRLRVGRAEGLEPLEERLTGVLRRAGIAAEFASGEYILHFPRSTSEPDA